MQSVAYLLEIETLVDRDRRVIRFPAHRKPAQSLHKTAVIVKEEISEIKTINPYGLAQKYRNAPAGWRIITIRFCLI
jgi:hypothetical protein